MLAGGIALILGAIAGFLLGATYDKNIVDGYYMATKVHAMFRGVHTHFMPFALYNMIIALMLAKLNLSEKSKKLLSIMTICSLILPLGLFLRGLTEGSMMFAPLGFGGGLCLLISGILVVVGSKRVVA
jgi:hypothetical protein